MISEFQWRSTVLGKRVLSLFDVAVAHAEEFAPAFVLSCFNRGFFQRNIPKPQLVA